MYATSNYLNISPSGILKEIVFFLMLFVFYFWTYIVHLSVSMYKKKSRFFKDESYLKFEVYIVELLP